MGACSSVQLTGCIEVGKMCDSVEKGNRVDHQILSSYRWNLVDVSRIRASLVAVVLAVR